MTQAIFCCFVLVLACLRCSVSYVVFSNDFSLCFLFYMYTERCRRTTTPMFTPSASFALWQLGVSLGIVQGVLVAWGCHVHQQPQRIVVEAAVRYMLSKDCFVTVVEDYDSGEIFVRVRNFEQMKRLSSVTVFVVRDYVIFTHVDRLNAICQPCDMSPLGKMSYFRDQRKTT